MALQHLLCVDVVLSKCILVWESGVQYDNFCRTCLGMSGVGIVAHSMDSLLSMIMKEAESKCRL